ncbi:MAG: anti-sigma factor [Hyphomicrobiaceae bacterium]|nr:anti-sigma factor [Hyphomicrobiaceae bacterium]
MTEAGKLGAGPSVPDEVLAAEFALGLLDAAAHQLAEQRIISDAAFKSKVEFWQSHLAELDAEVEPVTPRPLYAGIEARLFAPKSASLLERLWNDLRVWRGVAAGALAVAVLVVGFAALVPGLQTGRTGETYVASLAADQSEAKFLALYDAAAGEVRLTGVSGESVAGKDYELWIIPEGKNPISLGVVPIAGTATIALANNLKSYANPSSVLAVTLEPSGGAPGGIPTGPVVAAGSLAAV